MQRVAVILMILLAAVGWATWSLRSASGVHVLGHPPASAPSASIASVISNPDAFAGQIIAITGRMTDRCPAAGCWFYLNDGTGDVRVDAGPGGFSVLGVPLGARVTAYGRVVQEPDEGPQLIAIGARS